jgi:hypothetical protein
MNLIKITFDLQRKNHLGCHAKAQSLKLLIGQNITIFCTILQLGRNEGQIYFMIAADLSNRWREDNGSTRRYGGLSR